MIYQPLLVTGRAAPLPWQIKIMKFNLLIWPLSENPSLKLRIYEKLYILIASMVYLALHYVNYNYLYFWWPNIPKIVLCVSTYLVMCETQSRVFIMIMRKTQLKHFLTIFYREIYIQESENPQMHKTIRQKLLPAVLYSMAYFVTFFLYLYIPVKGWFHGELKLMFKQLWPLDYKPLHIYLIITFINAWVGLVAIAQLFGESNMLSTSFLHIDGRYQMLQKKIENFVTQLQAYRMNDNYDGTDISQQFYFGMINFIEENVRLNTFVEELEKMFTMSMFIVFGFSSLQVCTILYNIFAAKGITGENMMFLPWSLAKLCELFLIGELGSTLMKTTDNMSKSYYNSGWERIIQQSNDEIENKRIMKLILIAMQINNRAFVLTGLGFFQIKINTVINILQGAFSYFTFLTQARRG